MGHQNSGPIKNHSHFGQFMNLSIGATVDYLQRYSFGLTYSDFFGRYHTDPATGALTVANGALYKDRGLLGFTFKTSF